MLPETPAKFPLESNGLPSDFMLSLSMIAFIIFILSVILLFGAALILWKRLKVIYAMESQDNPVADDHAEQLRKIDLNYLEDYLKSRMNSGNLYQWMYIFGPLAILFLSCLPVDAKATGPEEDTALLSQTGVIITLVLLTIPVLVALIILFVKVRGAFLEHFQLLRQKQSEDFISYLDSLPVSELEKIIIDKSVVRNNQLKGNELRGMHVPRDEQGLLDVLKDNGLPLVSTKTRAQKRLEVEPGLSKLVQFYLIAAAVWLVFGTTVGEYLGIKFVAPDADHLSWLSFGRLRPVHTNSVFWGWASLAMLGLAHYVVPRVGNSKIYSLKLGWYTWFLINLSVLVGTLSLMAGINNGGGEYREYVWPIMLIFAIGVVLSLYNFLRTISVRQTREIYIANWYIVSSIIFVLTILIIAYLPAWQDGLGETIVQGYYMHQGVGMWFMLFTLGLVYYFLPQQLNRPIYSYSLGILAFWAQIVFYTTIGTHHFVFSAIPWWLQTVAIVGSVGMVIPVVSGTTNFLMTFKGAWHKLRYSYTLPFFLVGIIFYFTGSLQGTAEAFRYTNLIWHFTDFTVAHSHLTMYGIISFLLWACIYAIVPRLTGREAPQITIGIHFWLAFIGLLFYTVPLMYGSTLRGIMWMDGKPFIESVSFMAPFWLWRAIGGSLMWISHLVFAFNLYKMMDRTGNPGLYELNINALTKRSRITNKTEQ